MSAYRIWAQTQVWDEKKQSWESYDSGRYAFLDHQRVNSVGNYLHEFLNQKEQDEREKIAWQMLEKMGDFGLMIGEGELVYNEYSEDRADDIAAWLCDEGMLAWYDTPLSPEQMAVNYRAHIAQDGTVKA